MKKTILLLLLLGGVAYYLHWFNFTTEGTGNNEHVNINIDKAKIAVDEAKAVRVLAAEGKRIEQDAAQSGQANQPANAASQQGGNAFAPAALDEPRPVGYGVAPQSQPQTNDPYDTHPAQPRSAKRPPPSDLDRGFE